MQSKFRTRIRIPCTLNSGHGTRSRKLKTPIRIRIRCTLNSGHGSGSGALQTSNTDPDAVQSKLRTRIKIQNFKLRTRIKIQETPNSDTNPDSVHSKLHTSNPDPVHSKLRIRIPKPYNAGAITAFLSERKEPMVLK